MTECEAVGRVVHVLTLFLGNTLICGVFLLLADMDLDKWLCGLLVTAIEVFYAYMREVMASCGTGR